jgi:hypothetical protein
LESSYNFYFIFQVHTVNRNRRGDRQPPWLTITASG